MCVFRQDRNLLGDRCSHPSQPPAYHPKNTGWPRVHYSLTARDRENLLHSTGVMARMMEGTGAALVMPVNDAFKTWRRGRDGEGAGLEAYLKVIGGPCVCVGDG